MTPTQRDAMAVKIAQTWPNGPSQAVWSDSLDELDYPQASKAYDKLRRDEERPPSVARFLAMYRTFDTPIDWKQPYDGPPISFDQYIQRLGAKASEGDQHAAAMLDIWADNEKRGLTITKLFGGQQ